MDTAVTPVAHVVQIPHVDCTLGSRSWWVTNTIKSLSVGRGWGGWGGCSEQERPYWSVQDTFSGHSDLMTDDDLASICTRSQFILNNSLSKEAGISCFEVPEAQWCYFTLLWGNNNTLTINKAKEISFWNTFMKSLQLLTELWWDIKKEANVEFIFCDENVTLSEILPSDGKSPSFPHGPQNTAVN